MQFSWDSRKSEENRSRRRIGFEVAVRLFDGFVVERADLRREYGELRISAIGMVDGVGLTLVYTDRKNPDGEIDRRIISARRSSRKERRTYEQRAEEA